MIQAPPAEVFPEYPASWYLFGESRELKKGPVSRRILGRLLVAFRTGSGRLVVMDGECAHLGADLGFGDVVGETIRCPFHHWQYGCDGACVGVPQGRPPAFARQRTYPVEERHGYLFFFNGREPLFPLPFFLGEDPAGYGASEVFRYVADCTWYMNSAHAFDSQHFAAVHDRELMAPSVIDCPAPYARRNSYRAKVVGDTGFDRVLRRTAGRTVRTTLTIWGGTFAVITADFERVRSGFLMAMEPLEDGRTLCHGIVLAPRPRGPLSLMTPLQLRLRRLFTFGYLKEEARRLRSTRYKPGSLGPADQDMIDFFHWVAALPQKGDHDFDHEKADRNAVSAVPAVPAVPVVPAPARAGAAAGAGL
ncbi:MAG: Rieske 2Fe-2S domain-containing protein [Thermoanaerobaculia bacterium]